MRLHTTVVTVSLTIVCEPKGLLAQTDAFQTTFPSSEGLFLFELQKILMYSNDTFKINQKFARPVHLKL